MYLLGSLHSLKSVKEESFFLQKSAELTSLHEHKDNVCMI